MSLRRGPPGVRPTPAMFLLPQPACLERAAKLSMPWAKGSIPPCRSSNQAGDVSATSTT